MREPLVIGAAALALAAAGCGGGGARHPHPAKPRAAVHPPANVIVFRRIRYEGATLRTLYLHRDGTLRIEVPSGGAGQARFTGRVTPGTLRAVKRLVGRVDWRHLSHRKVALDASGAYFLLRHDGTEHVAMASGMSADLLPIVKRLNGVLNGDGLASHHTVHRYFTAS